jgi:hypothetical protein
MAHRQRRGRSTKCIALKGLSTRRQVDNNKNNNLEERLYSVIGQLAVESVHQVLRHAFNEPSGLVYLARFFSEHVIKAVVWRKLVVCADFLSIPLWPIEWSLEH